MRSLADLANLKEDEEQADGVSRGFRNLSDLDPSMITAAPLEPTWVQKYGKQAAEVAVRGGQNVMSLPGMAGRLFAGSAAYIPGAVSGLGTAATTKAFQAGEDIMPKLKTAASNITSYKDQKEQEWAEQLDKSAIEFPRLETPPTPMTPEELRADMLAKGAPAWAVEEYFKGKVPEAYANFDPSTIEPEPRRSPGEMGEEVQNKVSDFISGHLMQALDYVMPITEDAEKGVELVGKGFELLNKPVHWGSGKISEKYPTAGYATKVVGEILLAELLLGGAKKVKNSYQSGKIKKQLTGSVEALRGEGIDLPHTPESIATMTLKELKSLSTVVEKHLETVKAKKKAELTDTVKAMEEAGQPSIVELSDVDKAPQDLLTTLLEKAKKVSEEAKKVEADEATKTAEATTGKNSGKVEPPPTVVEAAPESATGELQPKKVTGTVDPVQEAIDAALKSREKASAKPVEEVPKTPIEEKPVEPAKPTEPEAKVETKVDPAEEFVRVDPDNGTRQVDWVKLEDVHPFIEEHWDSIAKDAELKPAQRERAERLLSGTATPRDIGLFRKYMKSEFDVPKVAEEVKSVPKTEVRKKLEARQEELAKEGELPGGPPDAVAVKTKSQIEAERAARIAEREARMEEVRAKKAEAEKAKKEAKEEKASLGDVLAERKRLREEEATEFAKAVDVADPEVLDILNKRGLAYKSNPSSTNYIENIKKTEEALSKVEIVRKSRPTSEVIAEAVKNKALTSKEGEIVKIVADLLKKPPSFEFKKGAGTDNWNALTNVIRVKDPKNIFHEMGHWGFYEVLNGTDRIKVAEIYKAKYDKGELKKNVADTTNTDYLVSDAAEYFAEQFSQYTKSKTLVPKELHVIIEKVKDLVRKWHDKLIEEKLYDKDLEPFFQQIIGDRKVEGSNAVAKLASSSADEAAKAAAKYREFLAKKAKAKADLETKGLVNELVENPGMIESFLFEHKTQSTSETIHRFFKAKWKRQEKDFATMEDLVGKAPKTFESFGPQETKVLNEAMYEAMNKGLGFEDIAKLKGFDDATAPAVAKTLERYAAWQKAQHEKVWGPQVNKVWKVKPDPEKPGSGIYNPPVYQKQVDIVAEIKPGDFKDVPLLRFVEIPEVTFSRFGSAFKNMFLGTVRAAQKSIDVEHLNAVNRMKGIRKIVKKKDRAALDDYTFAAQYGGPEYLKAVGRKVPKFEELSPEAQFAYQYMRLEYENLFHRINAVRRMSGIKPFKHTENYFTFMSELAALEKAGLGHAFLKDGHFKNLSKSLKETGFKWDKRRKAFMTEDGKMIKMEHDAFKRFQIYQKASLRYIHMTPHLATMRAILKTPKKVKVTKAAGKFDRASVKKKIQEGKLKPGEMITLDQRRHFAKTSRDAYDYVSNWINTVALGRERMIGEGNTKNISATARFSNNIARYVSENLTAAYLGASVRLAFIQPTAIANTFAEAGAYTLLGAAKNFSPISRKFAMKHSDVLFGRTMDANIAALSDHIFEGRGIYGKARGAVLHASKASFALARLIDAEIALTSWNAFYSKARAQGMNHFQAKRVADGQVVKTQSSGVLFERAPIQQSVGGKFLTLFQTFTISQYNLIKGIAETPFKSKAEFAAAKERAEGIAKEMGYKPETMTKADAVWMGIRLAAGMAISNYVYEDLIGIDSPNPMPLRKAMEKIDEGERLDAIALAVAREGAGLLPVVSGLEKGAAVTGAGMQALMRLATAKDLPAMAEAGLAVGLPLPSPGLGTVKTAIKAAEEGESNPLYYVLRRKRGD